MTTLSAFALHTSPQKGRKALGSPTFVKTQVIKLQPDLLKKSEIFLHVTPEDTLSLWCWECGNKKRVLGAADLPNCVSTTAQRNHS